MRHPAVSARAVPGLATLLAALLAVPALRAQVPTAGPVTPAAADSLTELVVARALRPVPGRPAVRFTAAERARFARRARATTIVRDRWGVPHVYGATDADVVFGVMYAQAEDNFWLLEEEYIRVLGRMAEVYGDTAFARDAARRAGAAVPRAKAAYAKSSPAMRALYDAFADGVNHWIAAHPAAPRLLARWEPWYALAFETGTPGGATGPTLAALGLAPRGSDTTGRASFAEPPGEGLPEAIEGSNAWAIAPSKTTSGRAMLFANPHWSFFQDAQRWEVHLESGAGWRFSGFCILGNPIPRTGHNDRLGWTHTNSAVDGDDVWSVTFDHPTDSLAYRYGSGWRRATAWTDTVWVRTDSGRVARVLRGRRTHHGPVFAWPGSARALAVRTVAMEVKASPLEQRYRMGRSRDLAAWRRAMDLRTFAGSATTYADADGNILIAFGNAAPKRRPGVEWRGVLNGADSTTEWLGLHPFAEIPQLVNPATGYVQNTNSSAWHATGEGANLDSAAWAPYLALDRENARARSSRRILEATPKFSFEAFARAAMDTRIQLADEELPALLAEADRLASASPARAAALAPLVDSLRAWDHVSDTTSVATTLFVQWERDRRATGGRQGDTAWRRVAGLERVRDSLVAAHGRWQVRFGEINRIQRVHASGVLPFDSTRASFAAPNLDSGFGTIANMTATPAPRLGLQRDARATRSSTAARRHGISGNSYVAVVEFAPAVRARSLLVFGQSADSTSPHHVDQAPLFARGEFKEAWYTPDEVEANAERAYHPGGPALARARVPAFARRARAAAPPRAASR